MANYPATYLKFNESTPESSPEHLITNSTEEISSVKQPSSDSPQFEEPYQICSMDNSRLVKLRPIKVNIVRFEEPTPDPGIPKITP